VVGERYYGDQPAVMADDLSQELGIPPDMVDQVLTALSSAGLIASTDEQPPRFLPARPWEQATLAEALHVIRRARSGAWAYTPPFVERAPVAAALDVLQRAADAALGSVTLKEFATGEAWIGDGMAGKGREQQ
jgi:DNA-binding IscR family transcriptional regulator